MVDRKSWNGYSGFDHPATATTSMLWSAALEENVTCHGAGHQLCKAKTTQKAHGRIVMAQTTVKEVN
jgi:hypothetical protein